MFYRKNKVKIRMKRKAWRACPFNIHFCGRRFTEGYIESLRSEWKMQNEKCKVSDNATDTTGESNEKERELIEKQRREYILLEDA